MEVKRTPTTLGEEETARLLRKVLPNHLSGDAFTREVMELTLAQVWLQSGQGNGAFNHNIGQVAPTEDTQPFFRPPWYDREEVELLLDESELDKKRKEVLLTLNDRMVAGQAPQRLRDFSTQLEGLDAYLKSLSPEVIEALRSGEPAKLSEALGDDRTEILTLFVRRFRKAGYYNALRSRPKE